MEAASFSIGAILRWLDGGLILCFFVALRLFMGISGGTVSQTDLQAQRQKVEAQSAQAQRVAYSADIQTWPSKQSVVRILSCYQVTFYGDRKTSWNVSIWHNPIQPLHSWTDVLCNYMCCALLRISVSKNAWIFRAYMVDLLRSYQNACICIFRSHAYTHAHLHMLNCWYIFDTRNKCILARFRSRI